MSDLLGLMPEKVAAQRELLRRPVAAVEPDPLWRWLELSCSLARHSGDHMSDVECGVGMRDGTWPQELSRADGLVARAG